MHTLVLLGELDHGSAATLEAEIERVCETGVKGITLDLSRLTSIDAIGVAVIAFRSKLCQRRGYAFALIAGDPAVQKAFERSGMSDRLRFLPGEGKVEAAALPAAGQAASRRSTTRPAAALGRAPSPAQGASAGAEASLRRWRRPSHC